MAEGNGSVPILQSECIKNPCNDDQRQRILNLFKGKSKDKIKKNYRYFFKLLASDVLIDKIFKEALISSDIINSPKFQKGDRKRHCLLKQILRLPEKGCFHFLNVVCGVCTQSDLTKISTLPDNKLPVNLEGRCPVNIHEKLSNPNALCQQIEVHEIRDLLYEIDILSADEHDHILDQRNRIEEKRELFLILQRKEDWETKFYYTLQQTNQSHVLDEEFQSQIYEFTEDIPQFGGTSPLSEEDNQQVDLVLRVVHRDNTSDERLIRTVTQSERIINQSINMGILDICEGDSVYFHIPCIKTKNMITNSEILEKVQKIFENISSLPRKSESASSEKETYTVTAYIKTNSGFLHKTHGKVSTAITNTTECTRCMKKTIITNMNIILNEVESDIIEGTFASLENTSVFVREACTQKHRPKVLRARHFINYVIQNEDALVEFMKVFNETSCVDLVFAECNYCEENTTAEKLPVMKSQNLVQQATYHVKIMDGTVQIETTGEDKNDGTPMLPENGHDVERNGHKCSLTNHSKRKEKQKRTTRNVENDYEVPETRAMSKKVKVEEASH